MCNRGGRSTRSRFGGSLALYKKKYEGFRPVRRIRVDGSSKLGQRVVVILVVGRSPQKDLLLKRKVATPLPQERRTTKLLNIADPGSFAAEWSDCNSPSREGLRSPSTFWKKLKGTPEAARAQHPELKVRYLFIKADFVRVSTRQKPITLLHGLLPNLSSHLGSRASGLGKQQFCLTLLCVKHSAPAEGKKCVYRTRSALLVLNCLWKHPFLTRMPVLGARCAGDAIGPEER